MDDELRNKKTRWNAETNDCEFEDGGWCKLVSRFPCYYRGKVYKKGPRGGAVRDGFFCKNML